VEFAPERNFNSYIMSVLKHDGRVLTTKLNFAKIEALQDHGYNLEEVTHATHSLNGTTTAPTTATSATGKVVKRAIKRTEPCFITKRSAIWHQRAHWVNAVRNNATLKRTIVGFSATNLSVHADLFQEQALIELGIVHIHFNINEPSNLTNRMLLPFSFLVVLISIVSLPTPM